MEITIATSCTNCNMPIFHVLPEKNTSPPEAKLWQVSIWMIEAKEGAKCKDCNPESKWEAGYTIQIRGYTYCHE